MKRFAFAFAVCLAFALGAAAQTVSVGTAPGSCGQSATVPVSIGPVSGLLSLEFRVAYDPARLTLTSATAGSLTSSFALSYNAAGGVVSVAMASGTAVSGSGTVASLTFAASGSASGDVPLAISNVLVNDAAAGGSPGSLALTCLQPPAAPQLVSPPDGASSVEAPVTLRWSAAQDATSYEVWFSTSRAPSFLMRTADTSVTVTTERGTTYHWSISAVNAAGTTPGPTFSFTTAGTFCLTPAAPQLSAPPSATSGEAFELTWSAVAGATEYVLSESDNASFSPVTSTAVPSTRITLTRTAASERTVYFRLRARNAAAPCNVEGALSATASVRIVPRPALGAGTRVIPIVASADGAFGSFFRTSLQLHNPAASRISGRLVFHPSGAEGTSGDPSMPYLLEAGETRSYSDIVTAMGVARSVGSLDLVPDSGSRAPMAVTRAYNDGGASGTSGTTLDALVLGDAIAAGQRGILLAPIAASRARMNIGIRTLLDGATLRVSVRDRLGAALQTSRVTYPPTYFVQLSLSDFTGNAVLLGDEAIVVEVESGTAMVYGSTTDNVTQDPSVQIARPVQ